MSKHSTAIKLPGNLGWLTAGTDRSRRGCPLKTDKLQEPVGTHQDCGGYFYLRRKDGKEGNMRCKVCHQSLSVPAEVTTYQDFEDHCVR
ncbi:hypothetical protein KA005_63805 [bacterium]|nr:hypothetical protein [bacterium]